MMQEPKMIMYNDPNVMDTFKVQHGNGKENKSKEMLSES